MFRRLILLLPALAILLLAIYHNSRTVDADEWQPISPEELKMTSLPEAPGAPAVILYRQVDRNDSAKAANEYNYVRVKILTEEGRKFADVELPFFKEQGSIHNIRARTIHTDGTVINSDAKAFDKTIVKARGLKYLAKTFTMPDVQVGSIIEYHYSYDLNDGYVYNSRWILSDELFTKLGKFSLKPNKDFSLRWSWPTGLPQGTEPPKSAPDGVIHLEAHNIPAFQVEDYMPPENELKYRVEFTYSDESSVEKDPDKFWKNKGKKWNDRADAFINKRKPMEQAVAQIVSPDDAPEVKLQKIYTRVLQAKNTSFELEKTEQEQKREKQRDISSVEDVWKQGSGNEREINWLLVGLARAAGLDAYSVYVSARSQYFFNPKLMDAAQLDADVVLVKLPGKDVFCDPGSKYAPLGVLPWYETGVQGLRLDKDGGTWVQVTLPDSTVSKIERKALLKLNDDGSLSGSLTLTFSGLEALRLREEHRNQDETERKTFLEDQVKESVPAGIDVDLKNKPEWDVPSATLVATYDLKIPGWASAAGRRALVPVGIFSASEKQLFEHTVRVHPIYFQFPYQKVDDVSIDLPLGWHASTLPKPASQDVKAVAYTIQVANDKDTIHVQRVLRSDLMYIEPKLYPTLRAFFQMVRTGDEGQVIVQPGAAAAAN